MLRFVCGDVRNSGENICAMSSRAFNAVSVVDTTLARFVIDVEVLKVVVEVDAASAQIATKKGGMGRENCCHIDVSFPAKRDGKASLLLVEMGNDGLLKVMSDKLSKEPGNKITKDDRLIRFMVIGWSWDTGKVPKIAFHSSRLE